MGVGKKLNRPLLLASSSDATVNNKSSITLQAFLRILSFPQCLPLSSRQFRWTAALWSTAAPTITVRPSGHTVASGAQMTRRGIYRLVRILASCPSPPRQQRPLSATRRLYLRSPPQISPVRSGRQHSGARMCARSAVHAGTWSAPAARTPSHSTTTSRAQHTTTARNTVSPRVTMRARKYLNKKRK